MRLYQVGMSPRVHRSRGQQALALASCRESSDAQSIRHHPYVVYVPLLSLLDIHIMLGAVHTPVSLIAWGDP